MAITIRPATAADLDAATALFIARDDHPYLGEAVARYVCDFDPRRCLAWLAFDGARPVGMSMLYLRPLRDRGADHQVGYWGNLFVHPDYRKAMVYPRLPLQMFRGAKQAGLDLVMTCSRRSESSSVHLQLGCARLGEIPVLAKPLRPASLLAQRRKIAWAEGLPSRLADRLFGAAARAYTLPEELRGGVLELPFSSTVVDELVELRH